LERGEVVDVEDPGETDEEDVEGAVDEGH
jgi:hypothetical protein